ncbi:MAG TPA: HU family DNA-binding protein [Acidimicrobiia bacterium]|nr:HU family DNA-binding protein [Acidimicrobiia bacterium]
MFHFLRGGFVNRRELVLALAERTDTDRKTADAMLQGFIDTVTENVAKGEPVRITGFAKFARIDRSARMGRNPATGETIRIKAKRVAKITPLKEFKEAALAGKATKKTAKKRAVRKPAVRKTAVRKPAVRKPAVRKPAVRKTAAKKTAVKKTAKKTTRKTTRR